MRIRNFRHVGRQTFPPTGYTITKMHPLQEVQESHLTQSYINTEDSLMDTVEEQNLTVLGLPPSNGEQRLVILWRKKNSVIL